MWNWVQEVESYRKAALPFVIATVVRVTGSAPREVGAKLIIDSNGRFSGTIGGGQLEALVMGHAASCIARGESIIEKFDLCSKTGQCCGGSVDVFMDVQNLGPHVFIFGAGHVGQALAKALALTSFEVHLIDDRKEWIYLPEIPKEVICHDSEWQSVVDSVVFSNDRSYCIVMTPSHSRDQDIIEALLEKHVKFIGLIGSRLKWIKFQSNLLKKGIKKEKLSKVHCPVGLKLGGNLPHEIAISISAQLLTIHDS